MYSEKLIAQVEGDEDYLDEITKEDAQKLRRAVDKAVSERKSSFDYEGEPVNVKYAQEVLRFLKDKNARREARELF